jgi:hypothetical protein
LGKRLHSEARVHDRRARRARSELTALLAG